MALNVVHDEGLAILVLQRVPALWCPTARLIHVGLASIETQYPGMKAGLEAYIRRRYP